MTEHHGKGGEGAVDLGNALIKACETKSKFDFLYPVDIPIKVLPANIMLRLAIPPGTKFRSLPASPSP